MSSSASCLPSEGLAKKLPYYLCASPPFVPTQSSIASPDAWKAPDTPRGLAVTGRDAHPFELPGIAKQRR
jgi:hypothetical protein